MNKKQPKLFLLIFCICFFEIQSTYDKLSGSSISSSNWVGFEFPSPVQISKISWEISTNSLFGIFEGANDKSFTDGITLFMIKDQNQNFAPIEINQSFKYIRFIKTNDQSSLSFFDVYGIESSIKEVDQITNTYQITNLPLVVVHTDSGNDPADKNEISCTILIVKDGKIITQKKGTIKLRGNSTMFLEKKSYTIKFEEQISLNELDFPSNAKKWVLLANYYDKTLLRNSIAYKMSQLIEMKYTPLCKHVDIIINGNFKGNYQICDKIEVRKGRLEIPENDSFLILGDGFATQSPPYFKTNKGGIYQIKYPNNDIISSEQSSYIENYFNIVENEIYNNNLQNIDFESFSKYFIVEESAGNPDCNWASIYLYKEKNDPKIYFGPVWDFDLAFDNDIMLYPTNSKNNFAFKYLHSDGNIKEIVQLLLSNEELLNYVKETWRKATFTGYTKENIVNFIDEQIEIINESQKLNFMRWDILSKKMMLEPEARGSYEKETLYLKNYIKIRMDLIGDIIANATKESVNEEVENGGWWGGWGN